MNLDNEFSSKVSFPDAKNAFRFVPKTTFDIAHSCAYLLDASTLLTPFNAGTKSLVAIRKVYENLKSKNQLFIPAQAAREYLVNKPKKIVDLIMSLSNKNSLNYPFLEEYPLLEDLQEYQEIQKIEITIKDCIQKQKKSTERLIKKISSMSWDNPVTKMYNEILSDLVMDDAFIDYGTVESELKYRNELKLPPGYKDQSKAVNSGGDLLIWKEILNFGKEYRNDVIFVTGELKSDWWHISNNKPISPRVELLEEYQSISGGKTFQLATLSGVLELHDVNSTIISEIQDIETKSHKYLTDSIGSFVFNYEGKRWIVAFKRAYFEDEIVFSLHFTDHTLFLMPGNVLRFTSSTRKLILEENELQTQSL